MWRPRQEHEIEGGPVTNDIATHFPVTHLTVRQQIDRHGGRKQTDLFDANGKMTESFSNGQELPDRQTRFDGAMGRITTKMYKEKLAQHNIRKNEIEGKTLGNDHTLPLGNMPFVPERAGVQPHKRKLIEVEGHNQVSGAVFHTPQPLSEHPEMRLFKDRTMDGPRPGIFLSQTEIESAPKRIKHDVSKYRKNEFQEPRKPILHAEQEIPGYGRSDLMAHLRDIEQTKKWVALESRSNPGTPQEFLGYNMSPSSMEHRYTSKPSRVVLQDYQPAKTPAVYGRMPGREVDVSRSGQKFATEHRQELFTAMQNNPILRKMSRGVAPEALVPNMSE